MALDIKELKVWECNICNPSCGYVSKNEPESCPYEGDWPCNWGLFSNSLLTYFRELKEENEQLKERIKNQAKRMMEDPTAVLSCIRDIVKGPLTCGHPIEGFDEEKEVCQVCELQREICRGESYKRQLKSDGIDTYHKWAVEIAKERDWHCYDELE